MFKPLIRSLLAAAILAASTLAAATEAQSAPAPSPELEAAVTSAVTPVMAEHGIPGLAVGLLVDGQRHYFNFGLASKETGTPVTAETLFEIGSVSKVYTATLVGYAVASGKLQLDAPISTYVSELRGSAFDGISVLDAGMYAAGGLPLQFPESVQDDAAALRWLAQWQPDSQPGSARLYSSPSLALFGVAAARSMDKAPVQALEQVLIPALGVRQSWWHVPDSELPLYAQGYDRNDLPVRSDNGPLGAWGMKASTSGLLDFLQLQLDAGTLEPTLQQAIALTQTGWYRTPLMQQGLGWEIHPWPVDIERWVDSVSPQMWQQPNPITRIANPRRAAADSLLHKTGATRGFGAYVLVLPGRDIALVMLSNKGWPNPQRARVAQAILAALGDAQR